MDAREHIDRGNYRTAERMLMARSGRTARPYRLPCGPQASPSEKHFGGAPDVVVACTCGTTVVNPTGACPWCHKEGGYA